MKGINNPFVSQRYHGRNQADDGVQREGFTFIYSYDLVYSLRDFSHLVSHRESRSLKEIRNAIPSHLFVRRLHLSALYLARDVLLAMTLGLLATLIDPYLKNWRLLRF